MVIITSEPREQGIVTFQTMADRAGLSKIGSCGG